MIEYQVMVKRVKELNIPFEFVCSLKQDGVLRLRLTVLENLDPLYSRNIK